MEPATAYERVMRRTEQRGDCLLFTGHLTDRGYGQVRAGGRTEGVKRAHVVVWEHHHGPVPDGHEVCHRCDVPACVAIAHLWTGTHAENLADMRSKGRGPSGRDTCAHGHPRTDKSTYIGPDGKRRCRDCRAESRERYLSDG